MLDIRTFLDAVIQFEKPLTPELREHIRLEITPELRKDLLAFIKGTQYKVHSSAVETLCGIEVIVRAE